MSCGRSSGHPSKPPPVSSGLYLRLRSSRGAQQEAVEYLEEKEEVGLASATEALMSARDLQSRVMFKADEARILPPRHRGPPRAAPQ